MIRLDLDHLEIFFTRSALRAGPINRNIFPARARSNAFFRQTGFFVINPSANQTHPTFIFHSYTASKSVNERAMMVPFCYRTA